MCSSAVRGSYHAATSGQNSAAGPKRVMKKVNLVEGPEIDQDGKVPVEHHILGEGRAASAVLDTWNKSAEHRAAGA